MNSAMQAVVSVKAIAVYGDCPEYPAGQISMKTFVKWAAATRTDLQSYPALNDKMRVLEQCITPEAKTALWACTTLTTNGVPVDYPSDAVKNAASAANLKARSDFHIEWLTEIIAACSPNTSAHIVKEMEKVKFGEGASGGITGRCYQEDDVIRYMGKMLDLQKQRGDPMRTGLTNKVKLDIVKRALPTIGLKSLLESTLPAGTAPADDKWEDALPRLAKELKKSEDRALLQQSITLKERQTKFPARDSRDHRDSRDSRKRHREERSDGDDRSQRPFKKLKRTFAKGRRFSRGGDRTGGDRRGGRKGDQRPKALEDVECYNCGEKGHYANKCPKPKRSDSKGGGRGGGKRGGGGGRGGGKKPRSDVAENKA